MTSVSVLKNVKVRHFPFKRVFDLSFSLLVLLFGFPVYLLIGICLFISSPGPIFYSHERVGRGAKKICCLKFRTMYPDADKKLENLLQSDPLLQYEWEKYYKLKNDPRVFPFGKFLRKTSLDELPQFWNVIVGDLSVVGPRPCVREEVEKYFGVKAYKILSIRPGITGIWQTSGRNNLSWDNRLLLEEKYVDTRSFFLDLKLIFKTVIAIFRPQGAY